jgi:hypothetical protein
VELLQVEAPDPPANFTPPAVQQHSLISDLIDRPLPSQHSALGNVKPTSPTNDLPPHVGALIDTVLARDDLLLSFLEESELRILVSDYGHGSLHSINRSLLHLVVALGYMYDNTSHVGSTCDRIMDDAIKHFEIGTSLISFENVMDAKSLQCLLCATYFLLSQGRNAKAHSFIGSACSLAFRLDLLSDMALSNFGDPPPPLQMQQKQKMRLFASVLCLDTMVSIIVGLPNFLRQDVTPASQVSDLARQAEADDDLLTAALLRQSALLAIPLSIRHKPEVSSHSQSEASQAKLFRDAWQHCQRWRGEVATLMTRLANAENCQRILKELEITYHLGQIILFRPHLYYIRDMYAGQTVSLADSHYALMCIKAASSVVLLAESLGSLKDSWLTVHSVFSSVMCLVFLVAAHPATTLPSVAWQRACRGVKIIAANRCADNASTVSFEILKVRDNIPFYEDLPVRVDPFPI